MEFDSIIITWDSIICEAKIHRLSAAHSTNHNTVVLNIKYYIVVVPVELLKVFNHKTFRLWNGKITIHKKNHIIVVEIKVIKIFPSILETNYTVSLDSCIGSHCA